jgi:Na+-translocating ferredoxin:NAD+ oxidoreductase subunit C
MSWFTLQPAPTAWSQRLPEFTLLDVPSPVESSPPPEKAGLSEWIAYLSHADVNADRYGCPDLLAQLNHAVNDPIDAVICSALDGDASLRLNAAVAACQADQVVAGVELLTRLTGADGAWIATEAGAPAGWRDPLRRAAAKSRCTIVELPNDYPQADPTLLIYTLTGRRLPPDHLPVQRNILLLDSPAALAVASAGSKMAALAILDHRARFSTFVHVKTGRELGEIIAAAGVDMPAAPLYGGDWPRQSPILPQTPMGNGELTVHIAPPTPSPNPQPCIRCGWCSEVCPTQASPALLLEAAQNNDLRLARRGGLRACIECGVCDVICPSHLPLLAGIRRIKAG